MNLIIKRKETQELAAKLVKLTGDDVEDIVQHALERTVEDAERLAEARQRTPEEQQQIRSGLDELVRQARLIPKSGLTVEQALPYDENGLPV